MYKGMWHASRTLEKGPGSNQGRQGTGQVSLPSPVSELGAPEEAGP